MDAYGEMILELAKYPLHKERLTSPTVSHAKANTTCGDEVIVDLEIEGELIKAIGWSGNGCAISQAAMSMVADEIVGTQLKDVTNMSVQDIQKELGLELSPRRLRCAELGLEAVKEAIDSLRN